MKQCTGKKGLEGKGHDMDRENRTDVRLECKLGSRTVEKYIIQLPGIDLTY
jgi:hypothetical protein